MKKIPCNGQSLLCASTQINSHSIAVSELVFNSLDAGATSIAVRVNIQENTIQVADNGIGISIKNANCIGQKYMTSKYIDVSTLKSAPNIYGCRGQALANIINVSKSVIVTSRPASEETWVKLFKNGTEETIKDGTTRSSKGTTVEIRGFLYNLQLSKKTKDILGEIQSIKRLLEHLSLVHCNISLSLRDDSKNEIILKMHKNRDIYQTLSRLYGLDKNNFQEIHVEKGEYKIKAYINCDGIGKHLIFLNGKFIWNQSKLHETVNSNIRAHLKLRGVFQPKIKNNNVKEVPENLIQNNIPDYFIFIRCPYNDYDLSSLPKQYILEFKDWGQIHKLLKKVISFIDDDFKKVVRHFDNNPIKKKIENTDTKERVKKIMEQIMGTHSKNPEVSSMHKAVEGKQAKKKFNLSLKRNTLIENSNEKGSCSHVNDVILENKPNRLNKTKECCTTNKQIDDNYSMKQGSNVQCLVSNTVNKNSIVKALKKCDNKSMIPQTNIKDKEITKNNKIVKKNDNNLTKMKKENTDTKERVIKNMEQILGTHSKKPGVSSVHKAAEGKQKQAKKNNKLSLKKTTTFFENTKGNGSSSHVNDVILENEPHHLHKTKECCTTKKQIDDNYSVKEGSNVQSLLSNTVNKNSIVKPIKKCDNKFTSPQTNIKDKENTKKRKINTEKNTSPMFNIDTNFLKRKCFQQLPKKKMGERNETEIIDLRNLRPKINENMLMAEQDEEKQNFKQTIRKKIATRRDNETDSDHHANINMKNNLVLSNFDLLRTGLNTQVDSNIQKKNVDELNNIIVVKDPARVTEAVIVNDKHKIAKNVQRKNNISDLIPTYKSHNYLSHQYNNTKNNQNHDSHIQIRNQHKSNVKGRSGLFLTNQSQGKFLVPNLDDVRKRNLFKKKHTKTKISKRFQSHIEKLYEKSSNLFDLKKQIIGNTNESSLTIRFNESNMYESTNINLKLNDESRNYIASMKKMLHYTSNRNYGTSNNMYSSMNYGTNTVANVESDNCQMNGQTNWLFHGTYTMEETNEHIYNSKPQNQGDTINDNTTNCIIVSQSHVLDRDDEHNIQPITVCETVMNSNQIIEKEFGLSFNDNQNKISNYSLALSRENKNNITEEGDKNIQGISAQNNINEVSHHFNLKMNLEEIGSNVNEIDENTMNLIFVSKSQEFDIDDDHDIQPISVCETVMSSHYPSPVISKRQNVIGKHLMEMKKDLHCILNTQVDNNIQNKNVDESNNIIVVKDPARVTEAVIVNDNHKIAKNVQRKNNISDLIPTHKSHNYLSHQYNNNTKNKQTHDSHIQICNQHKSNIKGRSGLFFTNQSQHNFLVSNLEDVRKLKLFKKKNTKTKISKRFQSHIQKLFERSAKLFDLKKLMIGNTNESSLTIRLTESNMYKSTNINLKLNNESRNYIASMEKMLHYTSNRDYGTSNNMYSSMNYGTNTVANVESDNCQMNGHTNWLFHDTYTIEETNESIYNSKPQNEGDTINDNTTNFIFVSQSQVLDRDNEHNIQPITACETVMNSNQIMEKEFGLSFNDNQNKISNNALALSKENKNNDITEEGDKNIQGISAQNNINEVSHHFNLKMNLEDIVSYGNEINDNTMNFISVSKSQGVDIDVDHDIQPISVCETVMNSHYPSPIISTRQNVTDKHLMEKKKALHSTNELDIDGFNFMNRLCFLPKGMSPIFQNCQSKNVCDYNLSKDYYEKEIYNNFAADVRCNADIFKPKIQEVQEINTKDIDKANAKINKNDSDLKFNGQSLKNAKILGQIDDKFIAATMKECDEQTLTDYLVLFDQHAVHERIRLENNLNDYFDGDKWKPANIDTFPLLLSKDHIMYLHNHKEKFEQLGLKWTVKSPNMISIAAIPEAILGKSPRQVEKVIKAVKNLIIEEINVINTQGGTIFLYPKSIMDLVFSEACRNAIKFGDKLLNNECVELLKALSDCKTPFQCAHGRPVMAVIIETKANHVKYKITEIKPDGARRTELLKQTKEIQTPKQIQTPVSMKRTSVLYGSPV